jgi:exodeoxyribonuclease V alpha subunit
MLEITIKPIRDMFYDTSSNYGIFACEIVQETDDSKKLIYNNYGNFTVKGVMPKLEGDKTYVAKVKEVKDKKYGVGYEIVSIYEEVPVTRTEQVNFLKVLLTEKQVQEIISVYPTENIIELIENDQFDYKLVKGVGEATFEKIKEKILENKHIQKAIVVLQGKYGLTHNMIKKLVAHYNSPQLLLDKIQENPYILADEVDGIGFKRADEIAQKQGIERISFNRQEACLKYILSQNADKGHVFVYEKDLAKEMRELLGIKTQHITEFLLMYKVLDTENGFGVYTEADKYALRKHYRNEVMIAEDVKRLVEHSYVIDIEKLEEKIQEIEIQQGFDFTGEQREAIFSALEKNVVLVNGKAGTGKTSVIKGIVTILKSARDDFSYMTVALSGKASQRIIESTGLDSSTIHRFLVANPDNLNRFKHNRYNPVDVDLLIVDEASMINAHLFAKILEALENGTKIIICGDYSQLEPIGAGNVFYDLCHSKNVCRIELTQVHRQAMKSGILSVANEIREGISPFSKGDYEKKDLGELKDLHYFPYKQAETILKKTLKIATDYKNQGLDILKFQVITPLKKRGIICTSELNKHLQEIFNPSYKDQPKVKRGKIEFRLKDKVIHNGNNYDIGILNGTIGIIDEINFEEEFLHIDFEHAGHAKISFENLKDIDLSYALSVHRTQGSQFENCVFALDFSSYIMLSRQLVYTAITRSIKHCYLICHLEALLFAIKTDKSSHRNTFLSKFLSEFH